MGRPERGRDKRRRRRQKEVSEDTNKLFMDVSRKERDGGKREHKKEGKTGMVICCPTPHIGNPEYSSFFFVFFFLLGRHGMAQDEKGCLCAVTCWERTAIMQEPDSFSHTSCIIIGIHVWLA